MIRSSVKVQTPVVTNWRISSGVRKVSMVWCGLIGGGDLCGPLYCIRSTDHGGDQAVTVADRCREDKPQITLPIVGACGGDDTLTLQINHNSVNGALMAAGVQTHTPNDVRAGLGTVLNQGAANGDAGQGGEVH